MIFLMQMKETGPVLSALNRKERGEQELLALDIFWGGLGVMVDLRHRRCWHQGNLLAVTRGSPLNLSILPLPYVPCARR